MRMIYLLTALLFADVANAQSPDPTCQQFPYTCAEFRGNVKVKGTLSNASGNLVLGSNIGNALSIADFQGTTKGVLFPRLTGVQMAALNAPPTGLIIYNTDSAALCTYQSASWKCYGRAAATPTPSSTTFKDTVAVSNSITPLAVSHTLGAHPDQIETWEQVNGSWIKADVSVYYIDGDITKVYIDPNGSTYAALKITLTKF